MTLSDYKETYYYFSGMASTVTRQSAFAGIALIWIFKTEKGSVISLPESLFTPVFFLVLCLVFDLLQYIVASAIWGGFHRHLEKQGGYEKNDVVKVRVWLNWPALTFFWGKLFCVLMGYLYIFIYVNSFVKFV